MSATFRALWAGDVGTAGPREVRVGLRGPRGADGPPGADGQAGADGADGAPGAPGPNQIADATALGSLTDAVADALFLLVSNAAGDATRKVVISNFVRALLQGFVSGTLAVRQTGGTAGTDELHISHDGSSATIENKDGGGISSLVLRLGGGEFVVVKRATGLEIAPVGIPRYSFQDTSSRHGSLVRIGWSSDSNPNSAANDTELYRAKAGVVGISVHATAPADGNLSAGSVCFYTDGSGNLVIKLKDAGGTVRSTTIPLT